MAARPENEFPTIQQLHDRLSDLIDKGFGELPVQIVVVPDSTLHALANGLGYSTDERPALMIDLGSNDHHMPVGLISMGYLERGRMPSRKLQ